MNLNYLRQQTILVLVGDKGFKNAEKKQQRTAQGVISLREAATALQPVAFTCELTSYAYGNCGILSGFVEIEYKKSRDWVHVL